MLKRSYELTRVMGIPVRIHITLVILLIIVTFLFKLGGILYAVCIFASVALHELGHSWVAIRKGCQVREIMLLPIGGVAKMSHIPSNPRDEFLIAAAGPAASALLALTCWTLSFLAGTLGSALLAALFFIPFYVNLILCLFNLIPAFPMDGGRILRAALATRLGSLKATALAVRIGRILAVAFGVFALLNSEFILILIAIYIYRAAGAEYRAVYGQHATQQWFRPQEQEVDVDVSPPPYARTAANTWEKVREKTSALVNGLFKNWQ